MCQSYAQMKKGSSYFLTHSIEFVVAPIVGDISFLSGDVGCFLSRPDSCVDSVTNLSRPQREDLGRTAPTARRSNQHVVLVLTFNSQPCNNIKLRSTDFMFYLQFKVF